MSECRPDNGEGAGGKTGANTCNNSFGKVPCGCPDSISISYVITKALPREPFVSKVRTELVLPEGLGGVGVWTPPTGGHSGPVFTANPRAMI